MKIRTFIPVMIACCIIFTACNKEDQEQVLQEPAKGTLIDHGKIPVKVHAESAEFQSAIYHDNHVFVATTDGIWKNNLKTKEWTRAGLEGKSITALYKHPTISTKFFAGTYSDYLSPSKTLYISTDAGKTWQAANAPIFDSLEKNYETYVCFAVRPNHPDHIYANLMGGAMMAVSTDGGQNWVRRNNATESYFGYPSNIVFLPGNENILLQGSENPLDCAWIGQYDINKTNPVILENFKKIVSIDFWGNRRPNEMQTHAYTGENIYIGQEGALSILNGTTVKYVFKSEDGNNFPYSYIYGIWVNPKNTKHLLFGGKQNGENEMSLYETFDEGAKIARFTDKMGFDAPNIREIVGTDSYPAIIISDDVLNTVKLYLYKPTDF